MSNPRKNTREIYPPTGTELTAKSWLTEAPLRMLMNNLHPDVADAYQRELLARLPAKPLPRATTSTVEVAPARPEEATAP